MNIVVTGGTGFIGRPLCAELAQQGHVVTNLSRNPDKAREALPTTVHNLAWGTGDSGTWNDSIANADIVVHLAGESVGGQRWTEEFKARIRSSRIESTRLLVDAMLKASNPPTAFVCASAVGYYGDTGDAVVTEETGPGNDFLGRVCKEWEEEAQRAEASGCRVVRMRTGIVLGAGGALERMLRPLPLPVSPWKLGLGGPLGSGKQWMPWIHVEDTVGLYVWAIGNANVSGPVNVTAPGLVTNAEFSRLLGRAMHRPAVMPVPGFVLRALLGEFAESVLGGQRAVPAVAQNCGYAFRFPDLASALSDVLTE